MRVPLGSYIDKAGLQQLRQYKYVSAGSTPIDRLLTPFWDAVVSYVPLWVSPNLLTLLGFSCTLLLMALTCFFTPTLSEAAPAWVYIANIILLFLYQTLDAIDGKQARRTNTSTPLGQLFDHGCDSFSTVFAALSVLGTIRVGQSVAAFMLIAILQMQLFIYSWWELHFHEYRCHTGVTGVTEGQLVMMGMNVVSLLFGPETFTTSLRDVAPAMFLKTAPDYLLSLPLQAFFAFPFYLLLMGMLFSDVLNGSRLAANPAKAVSQLLGCLVHVIMHIPLYSSTMISEHPVLCYLTIICNTSIIALRLNLSATCRMNFSPVQWPVLPFWFCCLWVYAVSPAASGAGALLLPHLLPQLQLQQQQQQREYLSWVLLGVLLWSCCYLASLLLSTVSLLCEHFNICCFGVGQVARPKKQ